MIDATDIEKQCMERTLQPLGEVVAEIGMHKPLAEYTCAEVLTLIEVVVGNYQTFLALSHPPHEDTGIPF
ncbi:MAG: hypothetical protein DYH13_03590 [Alphaproteobacteria bacterium PRO2]|nr:hypothetical protein [Alphaproteobacteria bacterium PRO2]